MNEKRKIDIKKWIEIAIIVLPIILFCILIPIIKNSESVADETKIKQYIIWMIIALVCWCGVSVFDLIQMFPYIPNWKKFVSVLVAVILVGSAIMSVLFSCRNLTLMTEKTRLHEALETAENGSDDYYELADKILEVGDKAVNARLFADLAHWLFRFAFLLMAFLTPRKQPNQSENTDTVSEPDKT